MIISLSEQLDSDIKAYIHKVFGTYIASLDERFAADIREDVISASNFNRGDYSDDDISIAFQRVVLGRMGHPDWQIYNSNSEVNAMEQKAKVNTPVHIRPASIEEAGLFYSQMDEAEDAVLGTVGHIRMDFGASGKEFYHTWWPHNGDQFNTGEFKDELQKFVDMLRADGPLTNLAAMRNYCYQHGGKITEDGRCFGYIAETEHYRYCLRCTPSPGEYQGYLYSYDLRQQRMAQQAKPVGRITYASGEEQTFTDAQKYLDTIREELPYQATTGFRYETLTDDPAVRKAVDDILLDFAGEENPRRGCNYGLTEAGKQALREAADPDRPHTYAWFVMTDCNIPGEQIYRDLTLEEAIRTYLDSDRPEKRLGVTKDGIATVDLVRSLNGEQHFFTDHLQLDRFKRDPEIAAAVKTLRLELEQNTPQQGITIGGLS
ncbi:hypothetical protein [Youxingia wuxianensis]|uniref:Large polyvalent protein associated domain-containing protein n=1 Tax=Youxingia wuxianensis TaxID=2763678 RepID=A0A926EQW5_9FIRM|nr:hypothetical protein [Youxingia wuxianensis]MBC8584884.1 hypothetical protein [Youxingia wuxianensis]